MQQRLLVISRKCSCGGGAAVALAHRLQQGLRREPQLFILALRVYSSARCDKTDATMLLLWPSLAHTSRMPPSAPPAHWHWYRCAPFPSWIKSKNGYAHGNSYNQSLYVQVVGWFVGAGALPARLPAAPAGWLAPPGVFIRPAWTCPAIGYM